MTPDVPTPEARPELSEPATVLRSLVACDLESGFDDGRMYVAATAAGEPLLVAVSRPFAKGRYDGPLIELGSLALGLGADRVTVGLTGRAWSLDDPVVPVTDEGDMRQRVLNIHEADGRGRREPTMRSWLLPFDLADDRLRWHEEVVPGPAVGWLVDALRITVGSRAQLQCRPEDVVGQLARCDRLGHAVHLSEHAAAQLLAAAGT